MKNSISLILILLAVSVPSLYAVDAPRASRSKSSNSTVEEKQGGPTELDSETIEHIYTSKGLITTLHLATDEKIQDLKFGSELLTYEYEEDRNLLHLMPRIQTGITNMNMMIAGKVHVFIIHIESDPRVEFRRTFTLKQNSYTAEVLANAPVMQPNDIPVVKLIKLIDRVQKDPQFAEKIPNIGVKRMDVNYPWNGCSIIFKDVWQFPHLDMLVFRLEWHNVTNKLLYLNARQYGIHVANQEIPVTAATQNRESIYPGEMDQVFLFVQGHRLTLENEWSITLPPDEKSVIRLFKN